MSKLTTIVNNATVPPGEFGPTVVTTDILGVLQFTNGSDFLATIEVNGSNDGTSFGNIDRIKVNPGATKIDRLTLAETIKFFNPGPSFGPATIILKQRPGDD